MIGQLGQGNMDRLGSTPQLPLALLSNIEQERAALHQVAGLGDVDVAQFWHGSPFAGGGHCTMVDVSKSTSKLRE